MDILAILGIDSMREGRIVWMWIPFSRIPNINNEGFEGFGFYGSLEISRNVFDFKFGIHDEGCREVKAKPQHQRTSLPK